MNLIILKLLTLFLVVGISVEVISKIPIVNRIAVRYEAYVNFVLTVIASCIVVCFFLAILALLFGV